MDTPTGYEALAAARDDEDAAYELAIRARKRGIDDEENLSQTGR